MPTNTFMVYDIKGNIISIEDYINLSIFYIEHLNDKIGNKYLNSSIKELHKAIKSEKERYDKYEKEAEKEI